MQSPQQIPVEQSHDQSNNPPVASTKSKNESISQKIYEMAKSLANVTIQPSCKQMESFKQLQADNCNFENQQSASHQEMMNDLNDIEESLLRLERQILIHQAGTRIAQEKVKEVIEDCEHQLRRNAESFQQRLSQYSDKISDYRVQMVEVQSSCKQKALKLERDNRSRLIEIEKNIYPAQNTTTSLKDHYLKKVKVLMANIQEETRQLEKQKTRVQLALSQLSSTMTGRIEAEKIRQKQGFQQHYRTLQEIFRLLQVQVTSQ